jgi:rubredoxin
MARPKKNIALKENLPPADDVDPGCDESSDFENMPFECICPSCGKTHAMKLYWTGRGVPRKFCPQCRDREAPHDDVAYPVRGSRQRTAGDLSVIAATAHF